MTGRPGLFVVEVHDRSAINHRSTGFWIRVIPGGENQHGFQKPVKRRQIGGSAAITSGNV